MGDTAFLFWSIPKLSMRNKSAYLEALHLSMVQNYFWQNETNEQQRFEEWNWNRSKHMPFEIACLQKYFFEICNSLITLYPWAWCQISVARCNLANEEMQLKVWKKKHSLCYSLCFGFVSNSAIHSVEFYHWECDWYNCWIFRHHMFVKYEHFGEYFESL